MKVIARRRLPGRTLLMSLAVTLPGVVGATTSANALPEIRMHERNRVPACVTPERLMQYMEQRNRALPERFKRIAAYYKMHGEQQRIRWDYAFYQMLIETNFLTYRTGAGKWGDVKPTQNNFAGIGATGGGVPGDRYPNVSTGVLAQIQHLVAYSGEIVVNPVAPRTREVQQKVVELSRAVGRPLNYRDLAGRWAADRKYGQSIEFIAERFRAQFCNGQPEQQIAANERAPTTAAIAPTKARFEPAPTSKKRSLPGNRGMPADEDLVVNDDDGDPTPPRSTRTAQRPPTVNAGAFAPPSAPRAEPRVAQAPPPAERPRMCKVWTASYGGNRNVLIQTVVGEELHLTALQVLDGREEELAATFIETHAVGGNKVAGSFPNREAALARAFDICPQAARLQQR